MPERDCTRAVLAGELRAALYAVARVPGRRTAERLRAVRAVESAERALSAHDRAHGLRKAG